MASSLVPEEQVRFVRLLWVDAAGVKRCRVVPCSSWEEVMQTGVGVAYACMWLPAWGDSPPNDPSITPAGEMRIVPDPTTLRTLPWHPTHAMALVRCCDTPPDRAWECCPRTALQRVLGLLEQRHGIIMQVGFELEFSLLRKPAVPLHPGPPGFPMPPPSGPHPPPYGMHPPPHGMPPHMAGHHSFPGGAGGPPFPPHPPPLRMGVPPPVDSSVYCQASAFDAMATVLDEMCAALSSLGIAVEQLHPESAPGQFELALRHGSALEAADGVLLAREAVAAVAARHDLVASFLPKLLPDAAGNGQHAHFSLWRGGANLLQRDPAALLAAAVGSGGGANDGGISAGLGPEAEAFMAGILRHLPSLLLFTTPSPNSYRRLVPHCWSGAFQCWGVNNREAPLRLCSTPGHPAAANCELKAFDATANPYLGLAALAVAGLLGLQQQLNLPLPVGVDPGGLPAAQKAAAGIVPLPASLGEALEAAAQDQEFLVAMGSAVQSQTLVHAYLAVRHSEWQHFGAMPLEEEAAALYTRY